MQSSYLQEEIYKHVKMSNDDTEEEASFRERYAQELRKKKQQESDSYRGDNQLADERRKVNQQGMRTPGRRGEEISKKNLTRNLLDEVRRSITDARA